MVSEIEIMQTLESSDILVPYKHYGIYGRGKFGSVYLLCYKGKCDRVIKINRDFFFNKTHEGELYELFANLFPYVPTLFSYGLLCINNNEYEYLITERVDMTLRDIIKNKQASYREIMPWIRHFIYEMRNRNITHGDLHWDNIGFIEQSSKVVLFDLNESTTAFSSSILDLLQLIRHSDPFIDGAEFLHFQHELLEIMLNIPLEDDPLYYTWEGLGGQHILSDLSQENLTRVYRILWEEYSNLRYDSDRSYQSYSDSMTDYAFNEV